MKAFWQNLAEKFIALSPREHFLIFISGLVIVLMLPFNLLIDGQLIQLNKTEQNIKNLQKTNSNLQLNINELQVALAEDPNQLLKNDIAEYEKRLVEIDEKLLTLTADLIDPVEMRLALIQLLKLQPGVKLLSLDVVPAQAITFTGSAPAAEDTTANTQVNEQAVVQNSGLYRHGIKIKLTGSYFQLRDYLVKLEQLPWKFYWHDFIYELKQYPKSELEIEIYSLSTKQEFLGV